MSQDLFRRTIKAKILLNQSDCTEASAKAIISLITDKLFRFVDNKDMTITFVFLEDHNDSDRELVKLLFPLPAGVKLMFEGEDDY